MDDVFSLLIDGFTWYTNCLKGFSVTVLGFTFSMFDFLIAFIFLDLIIGLVFVLRPAGSGTRSADASVSERVPENPEKRDADLISGAVERAINDGSFDTDYHAGMWADYYSHYDSGWR